MLSRVKAAALGGRNQPYALIVVFCLLAICIIASGFLYYRHSVATYELEVERRLAAVTELRGTHIEQYRNERLRDVAMYNSNLFFSRAVEQYLVDSEDQANHSVLIAWLSMANHGGEFERVSLVDTQGVERIAISDNPAELSSIAIQMAVDAMQSGEVMLMDPYRSEHDQRIYLTAVSPVMATGSSTSPAAVVMSIAIEDFIDFAVAASVPAAGPIDSLLIQQAGDRALLLSDPPYLSDAALAYRLSVDDADSFVIQALSVQQRMVRGNDLRGIASVAYGRPIAESEWHLVSSIAESEAFAPLQRMLWLIIVLISALLIGVAAALLGTVLDTAEIRRKDDELQKKNVEMERFTYGVSHDLKSPLWTVRTFLGFLEEDVASGADMAQIHKNMHHIRSGTDRMSRLLDELLKMSRIGRQEDEPREVSVHEVIQEALDAVAGRIAERRVLVHVRVGTIALFADPSRLVEVWQNLLDNAVKYMGDQARPEIEIGAYGSGRDTVFFVKDNGVGIEAQYHTKVFELFERLDNEDDSTGLGLALVKRIVELYKGRIWVESPGPNCGSTFKFTLPSANMT